MFFETSSSSRHELLGYIVKRLILVIPVFLGVSLAVFIIEAVTPGDPVLIRLGFAPHINGLQIEAVRIELGLDQPLYIQYLSYLNLLIHGNLGNDIRSNIPVIQEIADTFPRTMYLSITSMLFALVVGIPIGIYSAMKQYSIFDRISTIGSLTAASIPNFWLAIVLILIFSYSLKLLPSFGSTSLQNLILPSIAEGASAAAVIVRFTRSSMLEVVRQDFIRTARSKGLKERVVIYRHALKNALIPIVTVIGLTFGFLLSGAFFIEYVFAYPGIGRLAVEAIQQKNFPVVQGTVLVISIAFVLLNLFVDIVYVYIDPRVKLQ
ncbi:MAG: ABC transporter permease [Thaumarchaeota archaeon]|nr:ABC transporter permease [Nitrososphaerota archaeon]